MIGDVLWSPPADFRETTEIGRFMNWLADEKDLSFADYDSLWRWSVADLEGFWGAIVEFFGIRFDTPYDRVLADRTMPGASWFTGGTLNYAEHMLGLPEDIARPALFARSQTRAPMEMTFGELRDQVARARAGLKRLGVGQGDRVVAYMPNIPETLIAFIATASLGATWATCAAEFGPRSVIDRFSQIEPKVLFVVPGYGYRDRYIERGEQIEAIRTGLPTLEHVVAVPYGDGDLPPDAVEWTELLGGSDSSPAEPLSFEPVPFDHPLYVLFSSGTTGLPKAIIHSHGGQLVEHYKHQGLIWDCKPGARMLWFATTAWMIWNALMSSLLLRGSIIMLDGDPTWPNLDEQWRVAEELGATHMGLSPAYLMACRKAGLMPGRDHDLSAIRSLHVAGAPMPAEGYTWIYEHMPARVLLANGSGGTDMCTGYVEGCMALPVYEGEISGPNLGVDAKAFDPDGNVIIGELGEMVITEPMPSMPVGFWGDTDGSRYRDAYFDIYPGIWRQGDWIRFTERGSCVVTGRSDATLNRGGVRLGTGEFYAVVEDLPEISDSLVVHLEDDAGGSGELLLFVVVPEDVVSAATPVTEELRGRIAATLRGQLSPRHVPDRIVSVPAIPRTLTGKKLEAPVKRLLRGEPAAKVASRSSLLDPGALDGFIEYASEFRKPQVRQRL